MHRILTELQTARPGLKLAIGGDEASHAARVKRLEVGESLELFDGAGHVATAIVEAVRGGRSAEVVVRIESVQTRPRVAPRVDVWSATPKGGRVDELVDGLSQVGAASWSPLRAERSVVLPRDTKVERLRRVAAESAKQAGRAWVLEIGNEHRLDEALSRRGERGPLVVMADATGEPYIGNGAAEIRLLVGPEGGWTPTELAAGRAAGAKVCRFGPHILRIETATVVACAVMIERAIADFGLRNAECGLKAARQ